MGAGDLNEQSDRNTVADVLRGGRLPRCGTAPGAPSKLRLGGDFPRLNVSARSGKCQAAHDVTPSAAIRSPPHRSRRLRSAGNLLGANVNLAPQAGAEILRRQDFALRRPALPQHDGVKLSKIS